MKKIIFITQIAVCIFCLQAWLYAQTEKEITVDSLATLKMAAIAGEAKAQYELGTLFYIGTAVKQDYARALRWFKYASNQGYAPAHNMLGVLYETGNGVRQNYRVAVGLYRTAAEKGEINALNNIADMYNCGRGLARHCSKAMYYYNKAAELGLAESTERYAQLFKDGCRMYEPTNFPQKMLTIPVFKWGNPSPELAEEMANNGTFNYMNEELYTSFLTTLEKGFIEKAKRTKNIMLTRHGFYTKFKHTPDSSYSAWRPSNFKARALPANNFWRIIKMEFFLDEGTTLADFTLPFQFRTSVSDTNSIEFTVYKDGRFVLETEDGKGDIDRFRSKKRIKANGKTTIEYRLSNKGHWMIFLNGSLFDEGVFGKKYVYAGQRNTYWFEGTVNIISLALYEMIAPKNYPAAYGLSIFDLNRVDDYLLKNLHRFSSRYHLSTAANPDSGDPFKKLEISHYNFDGWQVEGHERIYARRDCYETEEGEFSDYLVGLIVTGKNSDNQSISIPLQYLVTIDESNKMIADTVKIYFNSSEKPYILDGPEPTNILPGKTKRRY